MEQKERPNALAIFMQTLPYVFLRVAVYLLFGLALIFFLGIMGGLAYLFQRLFQGAATPLAVLALIALGGVFAITTLAKRYVIYLVRIAHVAVITEIWNRGSLPPGANQVAYGKEKVRGYLQQFIHSNKGMV